MRKSTYLIEPNLYYVSAPNMTRRITFRQVHRVPVRVDPARSYQSAMIRALDFPKWKQGLSYSALCSNFDSIRLPASSIAQHLRSTNMASLVASRLRIAGLKSRTYSQLRCFSSSLTRFQNDEALETPPKPPKPIDDSTSALDYKNTHRVHPPPLPSMDLPRARTAEEAVTNILYNTPPPSLQPFKK